jgi:hypothetical protein
MTRYPYLPYLLLLLLLFACGGTTSSSSSTSPPQHDAGAPACTAASADGIAIATTAGDNPIDPLGYPAYAIDGCTLVYVATSGELRARDLGTAKETTLAPASESPRRPAIAAGLVAWEATVNGASAVRVADGADVRTLAGAFDHAGEPRATGDAVAFTGWLAADPNGDTDVFLYSRATHDVVAIGTGAGQQRFSDVNAEFVAYSDFSEDMGHVFDAARLTVADIVVVERATRAKTVRMIPGKQAFPMLGSGKRVAYLDWTFIHPEPKLSEYALMVGDATGAPSGDVNVKTDGTTVQVTTPYVRPSVRGAELEWVDNATASALYRRPLDLSAGATSAYAGAANASLFGPASGDALTVIAVGAGTSIALVGVSR